MSVLVLHHLGSLRATPYDAWLADHPGDVLLLASRQHLDLVAERLPAAGAGYLHTEALEGYEDTGELEARALDLARRHGVTHLVACHERDMERAAGLREILDLPGQRPDSAAPFRDKVLMKEAATAAGLRVAPYREVRTATDLVAFAREHGFPLVLKPRDSAGSIGLRVLDGPGALDSYLADGFDLYGDDEPNLLVEAFVPGPMCHVDGLVVGGRTVLAWPSQYQYALSSFRTDTGPRMDLTLDVGDPLAHRLLEFTRRLLDALPGPGDYAFHAEVFHTPQDELVLCEIACRTGGAAIRDIVRVLFGVDPSEVWVRAQLGLPLPAELVRETERETVRETVRRPTVPVPLTPRTPRRMAGQMVLMKRPGRVVSVPDAPPDWPWIERFRVFVAPGQTMEQAAYSSDFLVTALVSGQDRAEVVARLRRLETWFLGELVLEEPAPHGPAAGAR